MLAYMARRGSARRGEQARRIIVGKGKVGLRALEIFEAAAKSGSLVEAANELGCAVSSVSHHLKRLEAQLGVVLIDHTQRPMALTPAGRAFQRRLDEGLRHIRIAFRETGVSPLGQLRSLRIAIVDEFESDVAPELILTLLATMPEARFKLAVQPSHEAIAQVRARRLDMAIVTEPTDLPGDMVVRPLLLDPFVMATPEAHGEDPALLMAGESRLPFLRYNPDHLIGRLVTAHLQRRRLELADHFEIDSIQTIMSLVARGRGWSLMTASGYARAARFRQAVRLHPPPGPGFSRRISLIALPEFSPELADEIAAILRELVAAHIVRPTVDRFAWLDGVLATLGDPAEPGAGAALLSQ